MKDAQSTGDCTADELLGLDTDHVTERQSGRRVDDANRSDCEPIEEALIEAEEVVWSTTARTDSRPRDPNAA